MTAIIIDDERRARDVLRRLLLDHPSLEVVAEAATAEEALVAIEKHCPDLLFLDIHMPECDGFQLLDRLDYVPRVILVSALHPDAATAFNQRAVEALKKKRPLHLLTKPVEKSELANALRWAGEKEERGAIYAVDHRLFLQDNRGIERPVRIGDVHLIKTEGNYTYLFAGQDRFELHSSFTQFMSKLDPKIFFVVNRALAVNISFIDRIVRDDFTNSKAAILKNGEEIRILRHHERALLEQTNL